MKELGKKYKNKILKFNFYLNSGLGPYAGMRPTPVVQSHPLHQLQDPQGMVYPNFPMGNRALGYIVFFINFILFYDLRPQLPIPIHMFSSFVPAPPPMPTMPPPLPVPLNAIHLPGQQHTKKKTRRPMQMRENNFNSQASQDSYSTSALAGRIVSQDNGLSQATFNEYGQLF